ncbi:MAG: hypothetical protein LUI13_04740 [Lachnospiraceae bacterium]|nr:hypothetical protein [Lachnospiraceae bacterium]
MRIMQGNVTYTINIVWSVIPKTALIFCVIFLLLFVFALLLVRFTNPIELLHSENAGEKPPRANWLLGLAGVASICLLATSVLVILSAGVSLVVGIDDVFRQRYPTDFSLAVMSHDPLTEKQTQALTEFASDGLTVQNENTNTCIYGIGLLENGTLRFSDIYEGNRSFSRYWNVYILDLASYNALSGSDAVLADGEVLLAFDRETAELTALDVESVGCFAVFMVIYAVVYHMTSNAYYRLVSEKEA